VVLNVVKSENEFVPELFGPSKKRSGTSF
jgi:hypothetical protein